MSRFHLTIDAKSDLLEIRSYTIENWGYLQSEKYLAELYNTIVTLSENPLIGLERPDVSSNTFSFSHVSHVIYYQSHGRKIIIFAVLHKGMVPHLHLEHRNF